MSNSSLSWQQMFAKLSNYFNVAISVADNNGELIFTSSPSNMWKHNLYSFQESGHLSKPLISNGTLLGQLLLSGQKNKLEDAATAAEIAALIMLGTSRNKLDIIEYNNGQKLIDALLNDKQSSKEILDILHLTEIDKTLLRSTICIELSYKVNSYFNINLNLGYSSAIDKLHHDIESIIIRSKYLNSQDFFGWCDEQHIAISKSFINHPDHIKIYQAMDRICMDFESMLSDFRLVDVKIAYGNLYYILDFKKSYQEAQEILTIGKSRDDAQVFYNIDNIMIDLICNGLHPQILNKLILPVRQKLAGYKREVMQDLLFCAEAFIDSCMDYTIASKVIFSHRNTLRKKIKRLSFITGLNPAENFLHASIIKLLCVYERQHTKRWNLGNEKTYDC